MKLNGDSTDPQHAHNGRARVFSSAGKVKQRTQAANTQRLLYDAMQALKLACTDKKTGALVVDAKAAASLNRLALAWDKVSDRLRILRGRGLPASVRTKARQDQPLQPL